MPKLSQTLSDMMHRSVNLCALWQIFDATRLPHIFLIAQIYPRFLLMISFLLFFTCKFSLKFHFTARRECSHAQIKFSIFSASTHKIIPLQFLCNKTALIIFLFRLRAALINFSFFFFCWKVCLRWVWKFRHDAFNNLFNSFLLSLTRNFQEIHNKL